MWRRAKTLRTCGEKKLGRVLVNASLGREAKERRLFLCTLACAWYTTSSRSSSFFLSFSNTYCWWGALMWCTLWKIYKISVPKTLVNKSWNIRGGIFGKLDTIIKIFSHKDLEETKVTDRRMAKDQMIESHSNAPKSHVMLKNCIVLWLWLGMRTNNQKGPLNALCLG